MLANYESPNGPRDELTVTEALALADSLGVAVVDLLLPRDEDARVQLLPAAKPHSAWQVRGWLTGERLMLVDLQPRPDSSRTLHLQSR